MNLHQSLTAARADLAATLKDVPSNVIVAAVAHELMDRYGERVALNMADRVHGEIRVEARRRQDTTAHVSLYNGDDVEYPGTFIALLVVVTVAVTGAVLLGLCTRFF